MALLAVNYQAPDALFYTAEDGDQVDGEVDARDDYNGHSGVLLLLTIDEVGEEEEHEVDREE